MAVYLYMQTSDGPEKEFRLPAHRAVIGRSHRCDLRIPMRSVGMRQCEITYDGVGPRLTNLLTDDRVLLNGVPIEAAALAHGDVLSIGPVRFRVHFRPDETEVARNGEVIELKNGSASHHEEVPGRQHPPPALRQAPSADVGDLSRQRPE